MIDCRAGQTVMLIVGVLCNFETGPDPAAGVRQGQA